MGYSWHTFHVIMFHICSYPDQLNVTAPVGSNTLWLQSDLNKFDAIHKKKGGKGVPPNLCTCANLPGTRIKLANGINTWKIKMSCFKGVQETDNG